MKTTLLALLMPMLLLSQQDKIKHFAAGATISSLTYISVYTATKNKKKAIIYSLLTSSIAGVSKELYDTNKTGFNNKDLVATIAGGISFNITIDLFTKYCQ